VEKPCQRQEKWKSGGFIINESWYWVLAPKNTHQREDGAIKKLIYIQGGNNQIEMWKIFRKEEGDRYSKSGKACRDLGIQDKIDVGEEKGRTLPKGGRDVLGGGVLWTRARKGSGWKNQSENQRCTSVTRTLWGGGELTTTIDRGSKSGPLWGAGLASSGKRAGGGGDWLGKKKGV